MSGTSGFIGKHFVEGLSSFERLSSGDFAEKDTLIKKLDGVDIVVHLGAQIQGTDEEQMKANAGGTELLLKAMVERGGRQKLVDVSTFAVYAPQNNGKLKEGFELDPRNGYGKSKREAENIIREYAEKTGISAIILRLSNVYGPGMPPNKHSVVANFINAAINDQPLNINGDGNQERDFVYVDDVVEALNKSIDWKGKPGEVQILNICSGEAVSLNQLIDEIEKLVGKKLKVNYPNPQMLDNGVWIGDNSQALKVLDWKPKTLIEEGLRRTYEATKK